jgi:phosphoglycerol transferase MdoB-like AlkP superfamily enzyme
MDTRRKSSRHALAPVLSFVLLGLGALGASRLLFVAWNWPRVSAEHGLWRVLRGGARIDLSLLAVAALPVAMLAPFFAGSGRLARLFQRVQAVWLGLLFVLLVLMEVVTPNFIGEFGLRPNRVFFEYFGNPREVVSTLLGAYGFELVLGFLIVGTAIWPARRLFAVAAPPRTIRVWARPLWSAVAVAAGLLAARSGLQHRPINPSFVAFCDDALVNSLALNSLYSVAYEAWRLKDERVSSEVYGQLPVDEMNQLVRQAAGLDGPPLDPRQPTLHVQRPAVERERPLHLVIIVEESLGAGYVRSLGGDDWTPQLDLLGREGWWFTRMYATGTRSARGLEAIVTGFPPTPARAVLKLDRAQHGFFTLAGLLRQFGYRTLFVYGGEGHFDNMQGFFLGNGFERAIDRRDFEDPVFVGSWGVSDEDVLERVHRELVAAERPTLILAFSVSNHSPWEVPPGRIQTTDAPGVHTTVRYADWALGDFFRKARAAPYRERTIFAVVADHDARVIGANLVPVERFHIPALILGPGVPVRADSRLASQIDLAPTLLSLLGIESQHPMIGRDLVRLPADDPGRALLQYHDNFAFWRGSDIVVLQPHKAALQFQCDGGSLVPAALDPALARLALANALWPSWAYREERYGQAVQDAARAAATRRGGALDWRSSAWVRPERSLRWPRRVPATHRAAERTP